MSLRRLLLVFVLGLVAVGQVTSFLWIYHDGMDELEEVLDADVLSQANWTRQWLMNLPVETMEQSAHNLTLPHEKRLPADWGIERDYHLIDSRLQLWDPLRQRWWPDNLPREPIEEVGLQWREFEQRQWRTFDLIVPGVELRARLWQALDTRDVALEETLEAMLLPNLTVLALLLFVLGVVIHRGLNPLAVLTKRLQQRTASDLSLIPAPSHHAEIRQLTQGLNGWIERLDETLQRERGFASDVAHELRSPLAALQLQLEELSATTPALEPAKTSVKRISRVVEQLMSLARLEHRLAILELRPVALSPLLESLLGEMADRALAEGKEFSLSGDDISVLSEPTLLQVMLRNLVENAVKYSAAGGHIEVLIEHEAESVRCIVRDQGPGIAADRREEVTRRFVRLDTGREGAGLGLAIVARIADALGLEWALRPRADGQQGLEVHLIWTQESIV